MTPSPSMSFRSPLADYQREATALLDALHVRDEAAAWRFKWMHPRFRGKSVHDVRAATLDLADAQLVVAQEHAFETWADLARFTDDVSHDGPMAEFEAAVDAVVSGDAALLWDMLQKDPALTRARSSRRHHATLLHYVAANGVEGERQRTPANAVEIATMLLDAGAEADALADMYDAKCTTMSMLVSSVHPSQAGVQAALADTLLDHGAQLDGPGTEWRSAVMTALAFGYLDTAKALAARGAPVENLAAAAGLGRRADVARLLPRADEESRHVALALAAQHGHADIVGMLLDAGENPDRYNPDGFHSHSTPLHQAVWANHADVVRVLVDHGARLDIADTVYDGTPLGWAEYGGRREIAEYLRARGTSTTR